MSEGAFDGDEEFAGEIGDLAVNGRCPRCRQVLSYESLEALIATGHFEGHSPDCPNLALVKAHVKLDPRWEDRSEQVPQK
jgi:hypothetical protein